MSGIVRANNSGQSGAVSNIETIDSDDYVDGSIDNAHIADDAIDSEHYAAGSIDNAHLADDAVDSDELAAGAVDTAHIGNDQVTGAKLNPSLVLGDIIYADGTDTITRLAKGSADEVLTMGGSNAPTWAAAGGGLFGQILQDTKLDTFTTTSTSFTDITGLTQAITLASTDSKVLVMWHVNGSNQFGVARSHILVLRDSTAIGVGTVEGSRIATSGSWATAHATLMPEPIAGFFIDSPGSTSELTYKIQCRTAGASGTTTINRSGAFGDDTGTGNYMSSITLIEIL